MKVTMKKKVSLIFGIALVFAVLFITCNNIDLQETPIQDGYGVVSISFIGEETESQSARTVFPSTIFDKYVYTFTKEGEQTGVEKTPDQNGFFTLEVGNYTVAVQAYIGSAEPYTLAANGTSSEFSVASGYNDPVGVILTGTTAGADGEFSYTITYPAGTTAKITLQK